MSDAAVTLTTDAGQELSDTTLSDGGYEITEISIGTQEVEADGYAPMTENVEFGEEDVTQDFELEETGAINGTTTANGDPVLYNRELLQDGETILSTDSDTDTGEYLIEDVEPGEYTLNATRSGESREVTVQVNSGETTTQDFNIDF